VEIIATLVDAHLPRAVALARIRYDGEVQEWDISEAWLNVNVDYFVAMPVECHRELRLGCDGRLYRGSVIVCELWGFVGICYNPYQVGFGQFRRAEGADLLYFIYRPTDHTTSRLMS